LIKTASEKELVEMNSNFLMDGYFYRADLVADKLVELKPEIKDRVQFLVVATLVQGPEYSGDFENIVKYRPFQYINLTTE
jgi:hypothetical protein